MLALHGFRRLCSTRRPRPRNRLCPWTPIWRGVLLVPHKFDSRCVCDRIGVLGKVGLDHRLLLQQTVRWGCRRYIGTFYWIEFDPGAEYIKDLSAAGRGFDGPSRSMGPRDLVSTMEERRTGATVSRGKNSSKYSRYVSDRRRYAVEEIGYSSRSEVEWGVNELLRIVGICGS